MVQEGDYVCMLYLMSSARLRLNLERIFVSFLVYPFHFTWLFLIFPSLSLLFTAFLKIFNFPKTLSMWCCNSMLYICNTGIQSSSISSIFLLRIEVDWEPVPGIMNVKHECITPVHHRAFYTHTSTNSIHTEPDNPEETHKNMGWTCQQSVTWAQDRSQGALWSPPLATRILTLILK